MLHLPPAGTVSKDLRVKAFKVILRISEVKLHVVEKSQSLVMPRRYL